MVATDAKNSKHFNEGIKSQALTLQQFKTMNNYLWSLQWSESYTEKMEMVKQSQKLDLKVL